MVSLHWSFSVSRIYYSEILETEHGTCSLQNTRCATEVLLLPKLLHFFSIHPIPPTHIPSPATCCCLSQGRNSTLIIPGIDTLWAVLFAYAMISRSGMPLYILIVTFLCAWNASKTYWLCCRIWCALPYPQSVCLECPWSHKHDNTCNFAWVANLASMSILWLNAQECTKHMHWNMVLRTGMGHRSGSVCTL